MQNYETEFLPPPRLLLGAGPSNVHPRVLRAMTASLLGHMDPDFLQVLDDVRAMLRVVFQTESPMTWPVSGTGTAGMEAAVVNVVERGDTVIVATNGYFGDRLCDIASRAGANVVIVPHAPGLPVDPERVREELKRHGRVKAVAAIHAETSTGVLSPIPELAAAAHDAGALLIVDAVTSLGGVELRVDDWGIDVCYAGTQKCLACPPGLAPVTLSERAMSVLESRTTQVQSFYLDMTQLRSYFQLRAYHHTAPISNIYGLREGLRLLMEEGIEQSWARHMGVSLALHAGVEAMGLDLFVPGFSNRLPSLTTIRVPDGLDATLARKHLLDHHNIEVSGGLGETANTVWRVGLMGSNATATNVFTFLSALEEALMAQDFEVPIGASLAAAQRSLLNGD
jgi:alanine-glyoxylate transaminase/serine-glyoxylate transaminase/serine-pyruvate transaminase